jgi:hypothetical protein
MYAAVPKSRIRKPSGAHLLSKTCSSSIEPTNRAWPSAIATLSNAAPTIISHFAAAQDNTFV